MGRQLLLKHNIKPRLPLDKLPKDNERRNVSRKKLAHIRSSIIGALPKAGLAAREVIRIGF